MYGGGPEALNLVSASTGESYLLATMVPQLRRKLTRRPSEAEGAVNLMRKTMATAEEENKLKKQAKAKAKIGVRALRQEKPADNSMEVDGSASKGDRCTAVAVWRLKRLAIRWRLIRWRLKARRSGEVRRLGR